jgi:hypothetical protein
MITDYASVISSPVSIRDIASKARKLNYWNMNLFLEDFVKIWTNCAKVSVY